MSEQAPRIAIPVPTSGEAAYNARCWPQYAGAVRASGGEPVEIPLTLAPAEAARLITSCAGVLLPGSPADVHPQKYGEAARPETAPADGPRESIDELLLQDAFHLRKPLLGICFGMQMMNVWRGGSLVQHLETGAPHAPGSGSPPVRHGVSLTPGASMLHAFFGPRDRLEINSSHHQAVERAGDSLAVVAESVPDGVIEAVEGAAPSEHWVLGVQWHPERTYKEDAPSAELFHAFVRAASQWKLAGA